MRLLLFLWLRYSILNNLTAGAACWPWSSKQPEDMALASGKRLGSYEIIAPIGAGGMGQVYRARDTKLKREVAIKVLPEHLAQDPETLKRFEREAQAVAAVSHPNIVAIYDFGKTEGIAYAVTELLDGETLRTKLEHGALSPSRAGDVALQMILGLAAAHARGVVHRDLKPDNIFLTRDGRVKILDFGLAKLTGPLSTGGEGSRSSPTKGRPSEPGTLIGTVGYMSPEQVRGETVDHRADVFSFGAILYEMLSGRRAFRGGSAADTISSILNQDPPPLGRDPTDRLLALERLLRRCLEKDPEERFQSARDLCYALEAVSELKPQLESARAASMKAAESDPTPSIAVLPFADMSSQKDQEYFCEGMAEEIINALTRVERLRVAARTSTFHFKTRASDLSQIAEALRVRTVLEGSVRTAGNRLRVTAQLVNVADGKAIWSERYDGDMVDVFAIQDRIASSIVEALKVKLLAGAEIPPLKRYTENLEAYHLYLRGQHHRFTTYSLMESLRAFEQAVEKDPSYALAHTGAAYTSVVLGAYGFCAPPVAYSKVRAAVDQALSIDGELAEAHAALAYKRFVFDWDWKGAEQAFRRALDLNPADIQAHAFFGFFWSALGHSEEAMSQARRACELDPISPWAHAAAALASFILGEPQEALAESEKALDIRPDSVLGLYCLGSALTLLGRNREALDVLEKAASLGREASYLLCILGWACGIAGRRERAEEILRKLSERGEREYVSPAWVSQIQASLGRTGEALQSLEEAYRERNPALAFLRIPWWNTLRSEAQFQDLARRVGIPL